MLEIKQSQSDLLQSLTEIGFLTNKKDGLDLTSYNNRNFNNYRLVNACYSAGLYPQLAKIIRPPKRFVEVAGGAVEREKDAKELKFYIPDSNSTSASNSVNGNSNGNSNNGGNSNNIDITVDGLQRVFLHPSSINFTNSNFSTSNFVLFGEKQLVVYPDSQPKLYLRDTTEVTVFALLLFGGRLETYFMDNIVTLDNWIR